MNLQFNRILCSDESNLMLFRIYVAIVFGAASFVGTALSTPQVDPFRERTLAREFPRRVEWLNSRPLTKTDLKGKFVLLDFWTYCCITACTSCRSSRSWSTSFPRSWS